MSSAHSVVSKLASKAASFFTRHGDTWLARVTYANGKNYDWGIKQIGERFIVEAKSGTSILQVKERFYTLSKAQKFAARFIERADGEHLLKAAVDKNKFSFVKG